MSTLTLKNPASISADKNKTIVIFKESLPKITENPKEITKTDPKIIKSAQKSIDKRNAKKPFVKPQQPVVLVNPTRQTLNWLCRTYPKVFNLKKRVFPLKVGIIDDIKEDLSKKIPALKGDKKTQFEKNLGLALKYYVLNREYQQALLDNTHRFDLDGNRAQEIEESHRKGARSLLDNYLTKLKSA